MKRKDIVRRSRKDTNRTNSENTPKLKENYISNYQAPESIVTLILDKLINSSVRQSYINKNNSELNNYCFKFIRKQIDSLFEENYINYTKTNKKENNSQILFWKNIIQTEKDWVEIKEPESIKCDRFEGSYAHLKELEQKKKLKKIKEGIVKHILNIKKEVIIQNKGENENENEKEKNYNKIKKRTIRKKILNENNENKNINISNTNNINNNEEIKIDKKVQMFNFPSEDIPGIEEEYNYIQYDPQNIEKLRKEKELEIKQKEREIKLNKELLLIAKKKEEAEKLKSTKKIIPLDSNKFTFDSNGTIIKFKQYKLDNLTKDFAFTKNRINNEPVKIVKKKNSSIKVKNSILDEEEIIYNTMIKEDKYKKSTPIKTLEDKNQEKIIPSGSNFQIILPNIGVVIKENQNVKEGGREFNKFFNKYSLNDYDKMLKEYVPLQNKMKLANKIEKLNLSANNTNTQKKVSESVDNVRNKKLIFNSRNNSNNMSNTINNTSSPNNNLTDIMNNPLLNSIDNYNININDIDNINTSSYFRNSVGINSYNKINNNYNSLMTSSNLKSDIFSYKNEKTRNNFNDSITMKKAGVTSLKVQIDSLQDLENDRTYYGPVNNKQKNIFKRFFLKNSKIAKIKQSLKNPLSFNKNILTEQNWGNKIDAEKTEKQENVVFAKHQTKQQISRELGNNFFNRIKIRLPRERKVEINNNL